MVNQLVGSRFGRLLVIERSGSTPDNRARWRCQCDCGGEVFVSSANLKKGSVSSCGCIRAERARSLVDSRRNGRSTSPLSRIYDGMVSRCENPNHDAYDRYGGRGIKVCDRWRGSGGFEAFVLDMGDRPSPLHTIDRIDNDGDYEPDNCRWATKKEQARNSRANTIIHHDGKSMSLIEWSEFTGIKRTTISQRLRRGWSIEDAFKKGGR